MREISNKELIYFALRGYKLNKEGLWEKESMPFDPQERIASLQGYLEYKLCYS